MIVTSWLANKPFGPLVSRLWWQSAGSSKTVHWFCAAAPGKHSSNTFPTDITKSMQNKLRQDQSVHGLWTVTKCRLNTSFFFTRLYAVFECGYATEDLWQACYNKCRKKTLPNIHAFWCFPRILPRTNKIPFLVFLIHEFSFHTTRRSIFFSSI